MTLTLPRALSGSGWLPQLVIWGILFAAIGLLAARGQDKKPRPGATIGGPASKSVPRSSAAGVDETIPATPGTLGARRSRQRATRPADKSKRQDKPAQQVPRAEPPETPSVARRGGELYERLLRSTAWVVIRSAADPDSLRWGTGWVLDAERRLLITNQHVVSGGADAPDQVAPDDEVRVYFPQRRQGELVTDRGMYLEQYEPVLAEIFDVHVLRDLAVLRLASLPPGTTAVELARHGARPGDTVHSLGNPGASDALWVYTSGTVRQVYRARSTYEHGMVRDFLRVETQSPTNPGDSGGPVVNEQGELVAVNQGYTEGRLISWFIDVSEVQDYLASIEPYWAPASAEAFNDRGVHYYECGRYDRAAADFTEAIVRDAKLADAYNNRGWALLQQEDAVTAIRDFDDAIRLNPGDADYFEGRASARIAREQFDPAIEDLTEAIRLKPEHAEYYRQRGNAYHAAGEAKQAIRDLSQAIRRDPRSADYYNDRGLVHYDQDDYEAAEADFDQAIALDPDNSIYFYNRANTHYAADELTAAAADYLRMEQLDPLYAQGHRERFSRRYLKITNSGRESVRVHIRYHTQTNDNDWGWFPSEEGEWATYVFEPGESSYLSHEGFRVNADQVRIWAETLDASRAWQTFRTEPLRLVEEDGYQAYMMATLELEVGAAPREP